MAKLDLPLPKIVLEPLDDLSPPGAGFLRIVRKRWRARHPDGHVGEAFVYDAIERAALDAVVIVAHFRVGADRHVYLRSAVRPPLLERRGATEAGLWELPAGLIERGEAPIHSARRELLEELGFDEPLESFHELGPSTYPAPGIIGERHFYYEVEVDPNRRSEPAVDGPLEEGGLVEAIALDDALDLCRRSVIEDGKTELALRRLAERP
jgi:ADP-ribose pyrophosphatase